MLFCFDMFSYVVCCLRVGVLVADYMVLYFFVVFGLSVRGLTIAYYVL